MAETFKVGDKVKLLGSHSHAGEQGEIVTRAATLFNGWTVRLLSGTLTGASSEQMRRVRDV